MGGPRRTTIRDPERARSLAQRSNAAQKAKRAAKAAARNAAPTAATTAAASAAFLTPDGVTQAAQAAGVSAGLRQVQPSVRLRIQRLAPAWIRGWIEDVEEASVRSAGGLNRYISDTWGGQRYEVAILGPDNEPIGLARYVEIVGPVRSHGVEVPAPSFAAPHMPPPAGPPVAAAAPPAMPYYGPVEQALGKIAASLHDVVDAQRATIARLESLTGKNGGNGGNGGGQTSPDLVGVLTQAKEALTHVRSLTEAFAELAPAAPETAPRDQRSEFSQYAMRRLFDKMLDADEKDQRTRRETPPATSSRQAPPAAAGVVEAEAVPR